MKKLLAFFAAAALAGAAISAAPVKDKAAAKPAAKAAAPQAQTPAVPAKAPEPPPATGPTGLLGLKIGMTKEAVEALTEKDEVYLAEPLVEDPKMSEIGKRPWHKGKLKSPLSTTPVSTSMVFDEQGALMYFSLSDLSDSALDVVEQQLVAKYGAAKVEEKNDEEHCIYKNGANFKLPNKNRRALWSTPHMDSQVLTLVSVSVMSICPSNLRYGSVGPLKMSTLSFSRKDPKPVETQVPKKELF